MVRVNEKSTPELISDTRSYCKSHELAEIYWSENMKHTILSPFYLQLQGKIDRYHRSMKKFGQYHNYERHHGSI